MRMSRFIGRLLLAVALGWSANAAAQECTVASSSGIDFGTISANPTTTTNATGTFQVNCSGGTAGTTYKACVALGDGGTVPDPRLMTSGVNSLGFQAYQDAARSQPFATRNSGGWPSQDWVSAGTTVVPLTFTIYGSVLANQTRPGGTYTGSYVVRAEARTTCNNVGTGAGGLPTTFRAVIGADCTLDIPDVSFGTVTNLTTVRDTTTNASVTCTSGAPWTLSLNAGSTPGNTYAARYMSVGGTGAPAVRYQIYRDAGPANIWGNGTAGTVTRTGTGTGVVQSIPIYLQVPAQAPRAEGTYSDTVTATLTF